MRTYTSHGSRHPIGFLIIVLGLLWVTSTTPAQAQYAVHDAAANKTLAFLKADQAKQLTHVLEMLGVSQEHLATTQSLLKLHGDVSQARGMINQAMRDSGISDILSFVTEAEAGIKNTIQNWSSLGIPISSIMQSSSPDLISQLFGHGQLLGSLTRMRFDDILRSFGLSSAGRSQSGQDLIRMLLASVPRHQLAGREADIRQLYVDALYEDRRNSDFQRAAQISALQEANSRLVKQSQPTTLTEQNQVIMEQQALNTRTLTEIAKNAEDAAKTQEAISEAQLRIMQQQKEEAKVQNLINAAAQYRGY